MMVRHLSPGSNVRISAKTLYPAALQLRGEPERKLIVARRRFAKKDDVPFDLNGFFSSY